MPLLALNQRDGAQRRGWIRGIAAGEVPQMLFAAALLLFAGAQLLSGLTMPLSMDEGFSAVIWIYDAGVPGTMSVRFPPRLRQDRARWTCRDFGSGEVFVLACVPRRAGGRRLARSLRATDQPSFSARTVRPASLTSAKPPSTSITSGVAPLVA